MFIWKFLSVKKTFFTFFRIARFVQHWMRTRTYLEGEFGNVFEPVEVFLTFFLMLQTNNHQILM